MGGTSRRLAGIGCVAALSLTASAGAAQTKDVPHLAAHGTTRQLIVDGKPFLALAGELSNSSASSLDYLNAQWPTLTKAGLNTVVAPVEWDQLEPKPGTFDFKMVDGLLQQARSHQMRLVLLWFGAWKNSMSTYVPPFVKHDYQTYSKAQDEKGRAQDILSPFDANNLEADKRAFVALMDHLRATDTDRTVLMVQVENEIGMLPVVRDYGPLAQAAFAGPVPKALIDYLGAHRDSLNPYVKTLWEAHGLKQAGTWAEVFGDSIEAQEVFQAWYFAVFADRLAAAGKAAYPLPMYVNVALNRPGSPPGRYPSAGPLPHLFDIWKAAAPSLDMLSIDCYFPNFVEWADKFKRPDNPFFTPETNQAGKPDSPANAFYAFGQLDSISYSPFAIDHLTAENGKTLTAAYSIFKSLSADILDAQGTGRIRGFRSKMALDGSVDESPQSFVLGKYRFTVTYVDPWTPKDKQTMAAHGGLIIQKGENDFIVAGSGIVLTFEDADPANMAVGIEKIVEKQYVDGDWKDGRWLNGDESHQGRHLRIGDDSFGIQMLTLYKYK